MKITKKMVQEEYDTNMKLYEDTVDGREECYKYTADRLGVSVEYVKSKAW